MIVDVILKNTGKNTVVKNNFIQDKELGIISIYKGKERETSNWIPMTMELINKEGKTVAMFPHNEKLPTPSLGFIKRFLEKQGIEKVTLETDDNGIKVNNNNTVIIRPIK